MKRKLKKSFIFLVITIFYFFFLVKVSNILTKDKSNYVIEYEVLNIMIEFCKTQDIKVLSFLNEDYKIIKFNTSYLEFTYKNKSFYINCNKFSPP